LTSLGIIVLPGVQLCGNCESADSHHPWSSGAS